MAYRKNSQLRNPYSENQYGGPPQQQQQYRNEFDEGYGGHSNTRYNDSYNDAPYDTYGGYNAYNDQQPHQTYEQGRYNQYAGATGYPDDVDGSTTSPEGEPPVPPSKENLAVTAPYEHDDQMANARPRGNLVNS
jgi:hypothetical protein